MHCNCGLGLNQLCQHIISGKSIEHKAIIIGKHFLKSTLFTQELILLSACNTLGDSFKYDKLNTMIDVYHVLFLTK